MRSLGIGRKFGGSRPRIVQMMRQRALARHAEAVGLRAAGHSDPAIARAMGVHPGTVTRWFAKYGVLPVTVELARPIALPETDR